MTNNRFYIIPTYHPAAEQLLYEISKDYKIIFYNRNANDRAKIKSTYEYLDLKLFKIRFKNLDFAITNTLPVAALVLRYKPKVIVTEDFLFCIPYLLISKIVGTKIIYFNGSTSIKSTRVSNVVIKKIKSFVLRQFDEYWHGFIGAEKYINNYCNCESKLFPWLRINKPALSNLNHCSKISIIYVGEFIKRKRISYTIGLFEEIEKFHSDDYFTRMVGCDHDNIYFSEKYKKRSYQDVLHLMSTSHVLCLFSEREAMGAVVFEALAHGCYVILSKEVGANEIIKTNKCFDINTDGIMYFNNIGCIVDTDIIDYHNLCSWILKNKSLYQSNRFLRSQVVSHHYVKKI